MSGNLLPACPLHFQLKVPEPVTPLVSFGAYSHSHEETLGPGLAQLLCGGSREKLCPCPGVSR